MYQLYFYIIIHVLITFKANIRMRGLYKFMPIRYRV